MREIQQSPDPSSQLTSTQSNRARQARHQTSNSYSETLDLEVYQYREHFTLPDSIAVADSPLPLRFESDRIQGSIELDRYPSISQIRQQNVGESNSNPFPYSANSHPSSRSLAHPFEMFSGSTSTGNSFSQPNGPSTSNRNNAQANGNGNPGDTSLYGQLRWSRSKAPMSWDRRKKLLLSYAPDWIITIVLTALLALINRVYGFRREFSLTDTSIQYTYAEHERVPTYLLVILMIVIPIILIASFSLGVVRSFWDCHAALLGFILANALTITLTTIVKVTVGRPRPDFLSRCKPSPNATNAPVYGLSNETVCTTDLNSHIIQDGFRSFPSGHSSTSFVSMVYLSLYLAGKVHLFGRRGHAITAWLVLTPITAAILIAVSRTMDYRHAATDVIAGAILGILIAIGVYHLYYPSLTHPSSHKPFAPRIPREMDSIPRPGHGLSHARTDSNASVDLEANARTVAYNSNSANDAVEGYNHPDFASVTPGLEQELVDETVPRGEPRDSTTDYK